MAPWSIVIAEPLALIREALRELLARDKDLAIVGEAADAVDVRAQAAKHRPDILLLDASLLRAELLLTDILGDSPATSILVLTEDDGDAFLVDCLHAGAKGMVSKGANAATLIKALKAVATGHLWAPRRVMTDIVDDLRARATHRAGRHAVSLSNLTPRERTIVGLIGRGQTNKQIAKSLAVSEKTVRNHLTAIYRKLRCRNRTQLAGMLTTGRAPSR